MNEVVRIRSIFNPDQSPLVFKIEGETLSITGMTGDRRLKFYGTYFADPENIEEVNEKLLRYGDKVSLLGLVLGDSYTQVEQAPLDRPGVTMYKQFIEELQKSGKTRTVMVKLPSVTNGEE